MRSKKEAVFAPFVERFKKILFEGLPDKFYQYLEQLAKTLRFADSLLVVGYVEGALRKELLMVPFVERFKTATLGNSY